MKGQAPIAGSDSGVRVFRAGGLVATLSAVTLLTLAAAACSDTTGPNAPHQGILRFEAIAASTSESPSGVTGGSVEAPAQVRVGERFTATVTVIP